jgi:hypothetical protein
MVEPGPYATGWGSVGLRRSKQNPAYNEVRANIDRDGWVRGDPVATRGASLKVVDAERPPQRIFFGTSLGPVTEEYQQRLATWNE